MNKKLALVLIAAWSPAVSAWAGQVTFKNGDHITGKVTELGGGKLKVTSPTVGTIEVNLSDVQTFASDEPMDVRMKDGTAVKEKIEASDPGKIEAVSADGQKQQIDLANVKEINPNRDWTGSLLLGGMITRGNTYTDQLNFGANAVKRGEDDRITFGGEYQFGKQKDPDTGDKSTTIDNWDALGKYDYFLSQKVYLFGLGKIEHDRIADLDLRVSPSGGIGYQWVESPAMNFSTEAGLGWTYESFSNDGTNNYFSGRLAYHFDKKLNDKVSVFHNLEFLPDLQDSKNFNVNADIGIHVALTEKMFSEFKFEWKYDAEPAPDADKNDLRYILQVGWQF